LPPFESSFKQKSKQPLLPCSRVPSFNMHIFLINMSSRLLHLCWMQMSSVICPKIVSLWMSFRLKWSCLHATKKEVQVVGNDLIHWHKCVLHIPATTSTNHAILSQIWAQSSLKWIPELKALSKWVTDLKNSQMDEYSELKALTGYLRSKISVGTHNWVHSLRICLTS
jgi:hypothetical protein